MSELEMECVEEELEPWQKSFPPINLTEEDDDEPIFVGVVSEDQRERDSKSMVIQWKSEEKLDIRQSNPQTCPLLPLSVVGTPGKTSVPTMPAISPQPIIVNNQGFIVTPQITNNSNFITSLGTPGTSFTFVSAQPQTFQQLSPTSLIHGVVHRPQVQQIHNNIVTLSNVQGPAVYNRPTQMHFKQSNRSLALIRSPKSSNVTQNGSSKHTCTHCKSTFFDENGLKSHLRNCKPTDTEEGVALAPQQFGDGKRIMLVGEFYYGKFEGDGYTPETERTTTFKCQSCLKVLKNNIRFMNHMKHHLELEKQNSESFESHTTCQHCYRQYLTPFQLQCHIESAHSAIDSTTNCKICELAFESEQVLLDHMKNNHKPGEMPYVCNFRSSFFSDVETHFRDAHANTKDLLCPFCLKVVKSGHIYMQHYMRHQKKGIFRCGKCRLNFLSFKEKVEHRTQVHKTFRKPEALEGLPPGTKVTIRASLTGKPSLIPNWRTPVGLIVTPETSKTNKSAKSLNVQKSQLGSSGPSKSNVSQKKQKRGISKHNLVLKNFRPSGRRYICIECNGTILDFFSHFPMLLHCGACKYKTNCKKSIGNHMIRFHSTISKSRFSKENGKHSSSFKLTLLCLKCDLMDASGGNRMTKHLTKRPNHRCKVIQDKDISAKEQELPNEEAGKLKSTTTEMPKDQDETLSITSVTTANTGQLQPLRKSNSTDCEQDNGSSKIITEDSQEPLHLQASNEDSFEVLSD
ncbi:zinc finger protein 280D isoform X2 [Boleophthalmus pectinirostris]|uniref:zinc finger protein 280D isoform X2 n=1 Tax=Boleophthalmus pectinirostris TaxID=150288 RepID=UPI00242E3D28|nr:zinc finger protein 280D isoform X2 [Boleophthalmus pectinirostris]